MKIQITFKDPDGVYEAIREEAESQVKAIAGLDDDEKESLIEGRVESIQESLKPWIRHGEYITVEFDTETKTATVIPNR